jgi:hypothetical protein
MTNEHEDIVEIVECGARWANEYLERNYKLLGVFSFTSTGHHPNGEIFARTGVNCLLGRTKDIEHYEHVRTVKRETKGVAD